MFDFCRRPVTIEGSDFTIELDTLIVAISEDSGVDCITPARSAGIENMVCFTQDRSNAGDYEIEIAGDTSTGRERATLQVSASDGAVIDVGVVPEERHQRRHVCGSLGGRRA